ncbi:MULTISPECIES: hypothetical protein [Flavobacteriaceae]|uniref:Uncharacterized protein n=1 Tax=Meridianimaribacter flavus TaxID=571115 RepID=A0ABY2G3Z3_9FLAO|nr:MULTISPECIES: hypothetical protein [Meridianimaribacter]TDY11482.1 hypothetical protein A8975_2120 [Meridianimaribacter flavus]
MKKIYEIQLSGIKIGTTAFEFADTPMGVVYGKINFENVDSPYNLFKNHCQQHKVTINQDDKEYKFIDTQVIPKLKVYLENGTELVGWGGAISGMEKGNDFEIQFGGINSKIMKTEFAQHYYDYYGNESDLIKIQVDEQFKKICESILARNLNINQWAEIESSDEFQTERYHGGFDTTEMEFCFSYYIEKQEYWFQLNLNDIERIINAKVEFLYPRKAE